MLPMLISVPEFMWYIFFISAALLLLFCIITIILHIVEKRDETNKYGRDNFEGSLPNNKERR